MTSILFLFSLIVSSHAVDRLPSLNEMKARLEQGSLRVKRDLVYIGSLVVNNKIKGSGYTEEEIANVHLLLLTDLYPGGQKIVKTLAYPSDGFFQSQKRMTLLLKDFPKDKKFFKLVGDLNASIFYLNHIENPSDEIYDHVAQKVSHLIFEAALRIKNNYEQVEEFYIKTFGEIFRDSPIKVRNQIYSRLVTPNLSEGQNHLLKVVLDKQLENLPITAFGALFGMPLIVSVFTLAEKFKPLPYLIFPNDPI